MHDTGNKFSVHAEHGTVTLKLHAKPSLREDAEHFCFGLVDLTVEMAPEIADKLASLIAATLVSGSGAVELIREHPERVRVNSSPGMPRIAIAEDDALVFMLYNEHALTALSESLSVAAQRIHRARKHSGGTTAPNEPRAGSERPRKAA